MLAETRPNARRSERTRDTLHPGSEVSLDPPPNARLQPLRNGYEDAIPFPTVGFTRHAVGAACLFVNCYNPNPVLYFAWVGSGGMCPSRQYAEERAELDQVLTSEVFAKSPISAKLLHFICGKYFEDKAGDLKEYTIAVEALGRAADFDPTTSSVVRVEVHRVREKLKKYLSLIHI